MARRFPAAQSPPSPCCQAAEPKSKPRVAGRGFGEGQDPGAALRVKEMEGDALRARGREELDRNHGQAEGDIEVLQRARHDVFEALSPSVGCASIIPPAEGHGRARSSSVDLATAPA